MVREREIDFGELKAMKVKIMDKYMSLIQLNRQVQTNVSVY